MRSRLAVGAFAGAATGFVAGAVVAPTLPFERLSLSAAVVYRAFVLVWGSFVLFGGVVGAAVAYYTLRIRPECPE